MGESSNFRKRIKGLIGLILIFSVAVSMNGMSAYARTYTFNFDSGSFLNQGIGIDQQITESFDAEDTITVTGGTIKVQGDVSGDYGQGQSFTVEPPGGKFLKLSWTNDYNRDNKTLAVNAAYEDYLYRITYFVADGQVVQGSNNANMPVMDGSGYLDGTMEFAGWARAVGGEPIDFPDNYYEHSSPGNINLYAIYRAPAMEPGGSIEILGTYTLSRGSYNNYCGSFSIGDGFTYTCGSFFVPTAGTYTFRQ